MEYQNYIIPKYFQGCATVGLISVGESILGPTGRFVPTSGQILGRLTSPVEKSPLSFEVDLPIEPRAAYVDVDFNGKPDRGVQIYAAIMATNLFGDSYLEQLEQGGFMSILSDPQSGKIRRGTLLIYSPDGKQQFPAAPGKDGQLFTADDPVALIPKGYSLMEIFPDGSVAMLYDEFKMSLLEEVASETPDFSKQGILGSYNALLDLLSERYAYTEHRKIDWKSIRSRLQPRAEALEKAGDSEGYADLLRELSHTLQDGHVSAVIPYSLRTNWFKTLSEMWWGNVGATIQRLSDGKVCVTAVRPSSPAAKAGWVPGTEIVKVDGKSIEERLLTVPQLLSAGTPERIEAMKMMRLLSFPKGTKVDIAYRLPGEPTVQTATMEPEEGDEPSYESFPRNASQPFSSSILAEGAIGYVQWRSFETLGLNIAAWEHFLAGMVGRPAMIIDLRGNGGDPQTLYYTMASYLFTEDKPAKVRWIDSYEYNAASKRFELAGAGPAPMLHSPRPSLAYSGKVIILVDAGTASSAEFFSQYLQRLGRARVVAEMGTDGAGGSMRQVLMPNNVIFTYTGGQMFFEGTKEPNIEGKGVKADVRVPTTLENELAKFAGRDVVLEEAIRILKSELPKESGSL